MARVIRFDVGTLRKPQRTAQGFLRVDGHASRAGIQEYANADGSIRRELRPDDEVFKADSLNGFEGSPLTLGHPTTPVSPDNVKALEVGTCTSAARRDGELVAVSAVIKDKKAIQRVERGDVGLSVGYAVDLEEKSGVDPKYGRYDAIQRNIVVNHLAIAVKHPRAGEVAKFRMDEMGAEGRSAGARVALARTDDLTLMTTAVEGHQHVLCLDAGDSTGRTSNATADGAEVDHWHMWIRNADGSITIGEDSGHTHEIAAAAIDIDAVPNGVIPRVNNDSRRSGGRLQRADDELDAADRKNLKDSDFAVPRTRQLPIKDRSHVIAAMSRFGQTTFQDAAEKKSAYAAILRRAKALDIDSSGFEKAWSSRLDSVGDQQRSTTMDPEKLKETNATLEAALRTAEAELKAANTRADSATTERDEGVGKIKTLEGRISDLQAQLASGATAVETEAIQRQMARADEAERSLGELERSIPALIERRTQLMHKASLHMGEDFRMDGLDDRGVMVAVIKRLDSSAEVDRGVSDGEIKGRFDSLIAGHVANARSKARVGALLASDVGNAGERADEDEREQRMREYQDQWKQPLPNDIRARAKAAAGKGR